jgi:methionyl aminopeptidase
MFSIKTPEEIGIMAEGGKILAEIMRELKNKVQPGITTEELDRAAEALILNSGGRCSFKGHEGYPSCLCASINEEIVHGRPSDRVLKEGDIISLDLGIFYSGFHTDMAITIPVGKVSKEVEKLIETTKNALRAGIKEVKPGNYFGDIGYAVQKYVEGYGFNVVRELCGHGIGRELHEEPKILNYGNPHTGPEIKEGMVFCIEPMVTTGNWHLKKTSDGHGYETEDGSLSCHFEHTVAVTRNGCQILTSSG